MTGWPSICLAISILLTSFAHSAPAAESSWKAGVAKINITPTRPMWLSGYAGRTKPAEGKVHDLWAKALVLEGPNRKRAVLVSLDLVGIDYRLSRSIAEEITKRYGLPREAIAFACSHTHTGPVVGNNLKAMYFLSKEQDDLVNEYSSYLREKIVESVGKAVDAIAPARLSWDTGLATFAVNRRTNKETDVPHLREQGLLKGPFDHEVPVLAVRNPDGRVMAVVFGYACHATVLGIDQWTGDYPGFAQIELEKANPGAVALFFAGCGADQNPLPRRTIPLAEAYGKQLAEAVRAVVGRPMKTIDGPLGTAYREIPLPFADLPSRDDLVKTTTSSNKYESARAKNLLAEIEKSGSLAGNYPYPVQVWQLGSGPTWVLLGGEVVVDYSLRIKKEVGRGKTWVAGYANDVMAYIPSLRVLKEGGYEGAGAMTYYGLPTVWGPKVEELIVAAVHKEVEKARGK